MKKISVLVPCFNEENTIETVLKNLLKLKLNLEIIVIDDCSNDSTERIIKKFKEKFIIYRKHQSNMGKGASIRTALKFTTGEIIVIQDADLEYNPNEIPLLINPILSGHADVVYGSRFKGGSEGRVLYFWHRVGNQVLTTFSNMCTNLNLTDMETCYKAFKFDVLNKISIKENRFGIEPEITAKIAKIKPKIRIYEIGISYHGRTFEEGKKISWKDGIRAIYAIIRYNFFK